MSQHTINIGDRSIEIEVTSYTPYTPAKLFGPPEDCYPEEGPEIEFNISENEKDVEFLQDLLDECAYFYGVVESKLYELID